MGRRARASMDELTTLRMVLDAVRHLDGPGRDHVLCAVQEQEQRGRLGSVLLASCVLAAVDEWHGHPARRPPDDHVSECRE